MSPMDMSAPDAELLVQGIVTEVERVLGQLNKAGHTLRRLDLNLAKLSEWAGDTPTGIRAEEARLSQANCAQRCDELVTMVSSLTQKCRGILRPEG